MKYLIFFFIAALSLGLNSCFLTIDKGSGDIYFKSGISNNFNPEKINNIAVIAYSFNKPVNNSIISGVNNEPYYSRLEESINYPLITLKNYPETVSITDVLSTPASTAESATKLTTSVRDYLKLKGYNAVAITDAESIKNKSVSSILAELKDEYDAVFFINFNLIALYTVVNNHTNYNESVNKPFYLANSALIDTDTQEEIWTNEYYGILKYSRILNISKSPYSLVVSDIFLEYSSENETESAKNAAKMIFEPKYWPESFKKLPAKSSIQ